MINRRRPRSKLLFVFEVNFCFSVITKPPYEVTETGWGEFEVIIKLFFHDPNEKPVCAAYHYTISTIVFIIIS